MDLPRPSDFSCILSTSAAHPCSQNLKQNNKAVATMQEVEDQDKDGEERARLDLMLPGPDSSRGFNQELNLIDCLNTGETQSYQGTPAEQKVFSCNYCQRTFYSSQALGGHQNAHKRERTLAKRGQRIASAAVFGHPYGFPPIPFHGPYNNRSLGIQAHSVSHKPSQVPSYNGFRSLYGHSNWSRLPLDQQPAIGKLSPMENLHTMAPTVSPTQTNVGRFNVGRILVESPTPNLWQGRGGTLKSSQEEPQKLDLSLKL